MDQVIAGARPVEARDLVADVVRHRRGARREDRDIRATLALELELRALQTLADLIVTDAQVRRLGTLRRILEPGDLSVAVLLQLPGSRRVVTVTVDDHVFFTLSAAAWSPGSVHYPCCHSRVDTSALFKRLLQAIERLHGREHLPDTGIGLTLLADRGKEFAVLQFDAIHGHVDLGHVDRVVLAIQQLVVARDVSAVVADVTEERAERSVVVERE